MALADRKQLFRPWDHDHSNNSDTPSERPLASDLPAASHAAPLPSPIYTHFLDDEGMVRADLTLLRMADRIRVIDGADAGPRDYNYLRRVADEKGFDVKITDISRDYVTIGIWGPNARETLKKSAKTRRTQVTTKSPTTHMSAASPRITPRIP